MISALYDVDLAFVVDTTGSMGTFLEAARRHMVDALQALASTADRPVNLRVAVVEYRDHPPQDTTFVTKAHGFNSDFRNVQKVINQLTANGGGDAPEAVLDGLRAACEELVWRPHACRLAMLIGDSPPHGIGFAGDHLASGCPCGLTTESVSAIVEAKGLTLYALGLTHTVTQSFGRLAGFTGGAYFASTEAAKAIETIREVVDRELREIDFDRDVLEFCKAKPGWLVDNACERLKSGRPRIAASLSRLGRRGFFNPDGSTNIVEEPEPVVQPGRMKRTLRSIGRKLFGTA